MSPKQMLQETMSQNFSVTNQIRNAQCAWCNASLTIRGRGIVCASGSPYAPVIESPQQEMPCRISTHPLDNS